MSIYPFIQLIIAILLIVVIILQTRGTQAGIAFGGSGESYRSKKGIERILFYATVVLAVLFASISILSLVTR